jgi:hypothetical protein
MLCPFCLALYGCPVCFGLYAGLSDVRQDGAERAEPDERSDTPLSDADLEDTGRADA